MHFQPVAVGLKPSPHLRILVIRGVVLNEDRSRAAIVPGELMEEGQVGGSIEDDLLAIVEVSLPEFDGAEDLDALSLPSDGDLRRLADPAPGGVQRRVLAETGFVGKDQSPVLALGFFLRFG
jgi:hypothetical protein